MNFLHRKYSCWRNKKKVNTFPVVYSTSTCTYEYVWEFSAQDTTGTWYNSIPNSRYVVQHLPSIQQLLVRGTTVAHDTAATWYSSCIWYSSYVVQRLHMIQRVAATWFNSGLWYGGYVEQLLPVKIAARAYNSCLGYCTSATWYKSCLGYIHHLHGTTASCGTGASWYNILTAAALNSLPKVQQLLGTTACQRHSRFVVQQFAEIQQLHGTAGDQGTELCGTTTVAPG